MKYSSVIVAALVGNAVAYPQYAEDLSLSKRQDAHAWAAPGAGDVRSPCPGCNTLANHGYINRNGRDITAQMLQQGFLDAFGFDFAVTAAGAQNAVNQQGNGNTFNLDTMNAPHQIEHDASLTRNDLQMAYDQNSDNHDFNCTVWGETLALYGDVDRVDAVSANTARMGRIEQARAQDFPGWFVENDGGSLAEAGFYLTCMSDNGGQSARLDWLDYWFTNERLPIELGWQRNAISNDQFNSAVNAVQGAATTSPAPRTAGPTGCAPKTSSSPSSSMDSTMTSPTPYAPTYSASVSTYRSYPMYTNASSTATASPTKGGAAGTTTMPTGPSVPDVGPKVSSAAQAQASALAGPAPPVPNGYKTVLSKDQWMAVGNMVTVYVTKVEQLVISLCGLQGLGSMGGMPGVSGSSGSGSSNAPWYGSMGSAPSSGSSGSSGSPAMSGLGSPAATCACT